MALDLRTEIPRSPFAQIDGYPWLPRMIDKARAFFAGTNGEYSPYPCPGDKKFLQYFALDPQALGEVIKSGADDAAIAAWVREHSPRTEADKATYVRDQQGPQRGLVMGLALAVMKRKLKTKFQATYPDKDFRQIDSFAKMLALEEGYPVLGL